MWFFLAVCIHNSSGDVTHDFLRRVLDPYACEDQAEPDGRESQIVELSYYEEWQWIQVSIKDGIPDKIFKFSGCGVEKGTQFTFKSCSGDELDPVFTFWTRDQLNYEMDQCVQGTMNSCDDDEKVCECLAHYNDEYYFRPGLKDGGDGTYRVKYKAVEVGLDPIDWPCFPSVTATYVHDSTVLNFNAGVDENIVADFFYTGEKDDRKFDVVIFGDQECKLGNEIAGTVGTFTDPPFEVTTIVDPSVGSYPTEYTRVKIEANPTEWESTYWDPDYSDDDAGKIGQLQICLQFQVRDSDTDIMHEFVDVAYTINIDLMEECSCDDPSAKETTEAGRCNCPCDPANPTCGEITLIRDYVMSEDLIVDPDIGLECAPCDGDMTVTQGEKFPVCMTLVNDGDDYCLSQATALSLVVTKPSGAVFTFPILPSPHDEIIAGPLECDDDGSKCFFYSDVFSCT